MSPRSRPVTGPLLLIALIGLVPAMALWLVWQWADERATAHDAVPPPPTTVVPPPEPAPPLTTPLVSFRRMPVPLSHELNLASFRSEVSSLLPEINDRSCVAISVDGIGAGDRNPSIPVLPASVQKVMVAAAALEVLGEDFRYRTEVRGELTDGVVTGDLYLVGGGDPLLSGEWYPTSNLERFPVFHHTSLDTLADRVVAAGVTRVEGNVVGDGSRYDEEYFAPGWGPGVPGIEGGPYSALMANDSRVLGEEFRADEPRAAAAREFIRMLRDRGVAVGGSDATGVTPAGTPELATIDSAPLTDVVAELLTNSDNNTAELMVKEIGLTASGSGTRMAGLDAMRTVFEGWNIDLTDVVLADGSGLSRDNRLTCDAVLAVLQRSPVDGPIAQGLPVAGTTGTLRGAFTEGPMTGRLRGKTGTLNNPPFNEDPPAVKALAGYLPVAGGGAIEYALLLNGPTISDQSEYRPIWNELERVLATYPSGAGPDLLGPR